MGEGRREATPTLTLFHPRGGKSDFHILVRVRTSLSGKSPL